MALNILPAFDPGTLFPVRLEDGGFHPFDSLLNDIVDGLAPRGPLRLMLAQRLGDVLAVADPVFHGIDGGAGIIDRVVRAIDTKTFRPLLARGPVGELEIEGCRTGGDDADVKARAFAVVYLDPPVDPLLAMPIGEDDAAIAHAFGDIAHGFCPNGFGTRPWAGPWNWRNPQKCHAPS